MLSSDETQWNWHKGEITQNELKKLLGDSWPYAGTYRWSKDRENWNKTSAYRNPHLIQEHIIFRKKQLLGLVSME